MADPSLFAVLVPVEHKPSSKWPAGVTRGAFKLEQNATRFVDGSKRLQMTPQPAIVDSREATPTASPYGNDPMAPCHFETAERIEQRFSKPPKDVSTGFQLGTDERSSDVFLAAPGLGPKDTNGCPSTTASSQPRTLVSNANGYSIRDQIGKGTFSKVFKVVRVRDGRIFAGKRFAPNGRKSKRDSKARLEGIRREVAIMRANVHPNLMGVVDFCEEPEPLLVMPLCGESLDLVKLTKEEYVMAFRQVLLGLGHLHHHSIVHRDLKPANILTVPGDRFTVLIADFGLFTHAAASMLTTFCGTPTYIAPEVFSGAAYGYGPAVDIWSLGVIALEGIYDLPQPLPLPADWGTRNRRRWGKAWTAAVRKRLDENDENDKVVDILLRMIEADPNRRFTADECLQRGCDNGLFRRTRSGSIVDRDGSHTPPQTPPFSASNPTLRPDQRDSLGDGCNDMMYQPEPDLAMPTSVALGKRKATRSTHSSSSSRHHPRRLPRAADRNVGGGSPRIRSKPALNDKRASSNTGGPRDGADAVASDYDDDEFELGDRRAPLPEEDDGRTDGVPGNQGFASHGQQAWLSKGSRIPTQDEAGQPDKDATAGYGSVEEPTWESFQNFKSAANQMREKSKATAGKATTSGQYYGNDMLEIYQPLDLVIDEASGRATLITRKRKGKV